MPISNFKHDRIRDKKHSNFVRDNLPCCACPAIAPSDPSHIGTKKQKGVALKVEDKRIVPLCRECHRNGVHGKHGEPAFYAKRGGVERFEKLGEDLFNATGDIDKSLLLVVRFRNVRNQAR